MQKNIAESKLPEIERAMWANHLNEEKELLRRLKQIPDSASRKKRLVALRLQVYERYRTPGDCPNTYLTDVDAMLLASKINNEIKLCERELSLQDTLIKYELNEPAPAPTGGNGEIDRTKTYTWSELYTKIISPNPSRGQMRAFQKRLQSSKYWKVEIFPVSSQKRITQVRCKPSFITTYQKHLTTT